MTYFNYRVDSDKDENNHAYREDINDQNTERDNEIFFDAEDEIYFDASDIFPVPASPFSPQGRSDPGGITAADSPLAAAVRHIVGKTLFSVQLHIFARMGGLENLYSELRNLAQSHESIAIRLCKLSDLLREHADRVPSEYQRLLSYATTLTSVGISLYQMVTVGEEELFGRMRTFADQAEYLLSLELVRQHLPAPVLAMLAFVPERLRKLASSLSLLQFLPGRLSFDEWLRIIAQQAILPEEVQKLLLQYTEWSDHWQELSAEFGEISERYPLPASDDRVGHILWLHKVLHDPVAGRQLQRYLPEGLAETINVSAPLMQLASGFPVGSSLAQQLSWAVQRATTPSPELSQLLSQQPFSDFIASLRQQVSSKTVNPALFNALLELTDPAKSLWIKSINITGAFLTGIDLRQAVSSAVRSGVNVLPGGALVLNAWDWYQTLPAGLSWQNTLQCFSNDLVDAISANPQLLREMLPASVLQSVGALTAFIDLPVDKPWHEVLRWASSQMGRGDEYEWLYQRYTELCVLRGVYEILQQGDDTQREALIHELSARLKVYLGLQPGSALADLLNLLPYLPLLASVRKEITTMPATDSWLGWSSNLLQLLENHPHPSLANLRVQLETQITNFLSDSVMAGADTLWAQLPEINDPLRFPEASAAPSPGKQQRGAWYDQHAIREESSGEPQTIADQYGNKENPSSEAEDSSAFASYAIGAGLTGGWLAAFYLYWRAYHSSKPQQVSETDILMQEFPPVTANEQERQSGADDALLNEPSEARVRLNLKKYIFPTMFMLAMASMTAWEAWKRWGTLTQGTDTSALHLTDELMTILNGFESMGEVVIDGKHYDENTHDKTGVLTLKQAYAEFLIEHKHHNRQANLSEGESDSLLSRGKRNASSYSTRSLTLVVNNFEVETDDTINLLVMRIQSENFGYADSDQLLGALLFSVLNDLSQSVNKKNMENSEFFSTMRKLFVIEAILGKMNEADRNGSIKKIKATAEYVQIKYFVINELLGYLKKYPRLHTMVSLFTYSIFYELFNLTAQDEVAKYILSLFEVYATFTIDSQRKYPPAHEIESLTSKLQWVIDRYGADVLSGSNVYSIKSMTEKKKNLYRSVRGGREIERLIKQNKKLRPLIENVNALTNSFKSKGEIERDFLFNALPKDFLDDYYHISVYQFITRHGRPSSYDMKNRYSGAISEMKNKFILKLSEIQCSFITNFTDMEKLLIDFLKIRILMKKIEEINKYQDRMADIIKFSEHIIEKGEVPNLVAKINKGDFSVDFLLQELKRKVIELVIKDVPEFTRGSNKKDLSLVYDEIADDRSGEYTDLKDKLNDYISLSFHLTGKYLANLNEPLQSSRTLQYFMQDFVLEELSISNLKYIEYEILKMLTDDNNVRTEAYTSLSQLPVKSSSTGDVSYYRKYNRYIDFESKTEGKLIAIKNFMEKNESFDKKKIFEQPVRVNEIEIKPDDFYIESWMTWQQARGFVEYIKKVKESGFSAKFLSVKYQDGSTLVMKCTGGLDVVNDEELNRIVDRFLITELSNNVFKDQLITKLDYKNVIFSELKKKSADFGGYPGKDLKFKWSVTDRQIRKDNILNLASDYITKELISTAQKMKDANKYLSAIEFILGLMPFYNVISRKINDRKYQPSTGDMTWDIVDVTVSVLIPAAGLGYKSVKLIRDILMTAEKSVRVSNKSLKGIELMNKVLISASPKIIKLLPSTTKVMTSLIKLTAETFNPLALAFYTNKMAHGGYNLGKDMIKRRRINKNINPVILKEEINVAEQMPFGEGSLFDSFLYADEMSPAEIDKMKSDFYTNISTESYHKTEIDQLARNPTGQSETAAKKLVDMLKVHNYDTHVVGVVAYKNLDDVSPTNHYAVIVSKEDKALVIDVTFSQFKSTHPGDWLVTSWEKWCEEIATSDSLKNKIVMAKEFDAVSPAINEIGNIDGTTWLESDYMKDSAFNIINMPNHFLSKINEVIRRDVDFINSEGGIAKIAGIPVEIERKKSKLSKRINEENSYLARDSLAPPRVTDAIVKTQREINDLQRLSHLPNRLINYKALQKKFTTSTDTLNETMAIQTPLSARVKELTNAMAAAQKLNIKNIDTSSVDGTGVITSEGRYYISNGGNLIELAAYNKSNKTAVLRTITGSTQLTFSVEKWHVNTENSLFEIAQDKINDVYMAFVLDRTAKASLQQFNQEALTAVNPIKKV